MSKLWQIDVEGKPAARRMVEGTREQAEEVVETLCEDWPGRAVALYELTDKGRKFVSTDIIIERAGGL